MSHFFLNIFTDSQSQTPNQHTIEVINICKKRIKLQFLYIV